MYFNALAKHYGFSLDTPVKELSKDILDITVSYPHLRGDISVSEGHFCFACQMVSAVCTPKRFASSFFARMTP